MIPRKIKLSLKEESASPVIQVKMKGKMMKWRREKREDNETFRTLALQHGCLCCHVSACALLTVVLALGPADVSAGEIHHSKGCKWVCVLMSPRAAGRAGEKDTVRNSCLKELKPVNDSFAGLKSVVEIILKLV